MEEAGIDRIFEPDFTLSLRNAPPGLVLTDETLIPDWFWIPQSARLDRKGLLDTLKAGTAVTGTQVDRP
jgi:hypothetical protein